MQGGGNKKIGLISTKNRAINGAMVRHIRTRADGGNTRHWVFCMNQLGGVGRKWGQAAGPGNRGGVSANCQRLAYRSRKQYPIRPVVGPVAAPPQPTPTPPTLEGDPLGRCEYSGECWCGSSYDDALTCKKECPNGTTVPGSPGSCDPPDQCYQGVTQCKPSTYSCAPEIRQCHPDSSGPFATLQQCQAAGCPPPPAPTMYACDTTKNQCALSAAGTFATLQQCQAAGCPPTPAPPGCPGGSLQACIGLCPSDPATAYQDCVKDCASRCA